MFFIFLITALYISLINSAASDQSFKALVEIKPSLLIWNLDAFNKIEDKHFQSLYTVLCPFYQSDEVNVDRVSALTNLYSVINDASEHGVNIIQQVMGKRNLMIVNLNYVKKHPNNTDRFNSFKTQYLDSLSWIVQERLKAVQQSKNEGVNNIDICSIKIQDQDIRDDYNNRDPLLCLEVFQYWNSHTLKNLWPSDQSFINQVYGQLIVIFMLMKNKNECVNIGSDNRIQEAIIKVKGLLELKQHEGLSCSGNHFLEMSFPQAFNNSSFHEKLWEILYELYYYCYQLSSGNEIKHDDCKVNDDNKNKDGSSEVNIVNQGVNLVVSIVPQTLPIDYTQGACQYTGGEQNNKAVDPVTSKSTSDQTLNHKDPQKGRSQDSFLKRFFFKSKYVIGTCLFIFCGFGLYAMGFLKTFFKKLPA